VDVHTAVGRGSRTEGDGEAEGTEKKKRNAAVRRIPHEHLLLVPTMAAFDSRVTQRAPPPPPCGRRLNPLTASEIPGAARSLFVSRTRYLQFSKPKNTKDYRFKLLHRSSDEMVKWISWSFRPNKTSEFVTWTRKICFQTNRFID